MSLKAKIEAVIYAAEEPVTLAQIASLFQTELLEERTARLSAEAAPQEEAATEEPALDLENAAEQPEEASAESPESAEGAEKRAAEDEKKAARQRERELRDEARQV